MSEPDTLSPDRLGRITGSRIGSILGLPRSSNTRADVLIEMVRQFHGLPPLFVGNEMTAYGKKHEADGVAAYEAQAGVTVHSAQELVIHPFYDFLAITPDGLVGDDGVLEVKCPSPKARYRHIADKPSFEAQLRLAVDCTGRQWGDLAMWRAKEPLVVDRIEFDPGWLPSVLPKLLAFMDEYRAAINDPVVEARERGRGVSVEVSAREQFLADAKRWRELQQLEADTAEELGVIKARIGQQLGDSETATVDDVPMAKWIYRNGAETFDRSSFSKDYPELEALYRKRGQPSRHPTLITDEGEQAS